MKTHTIKFWHQNPSVSQMYPAVLGNAFSMDWVQKEFDMRKTFDKKEYETNGTILKCPGIFELYSRGFFIQQPYDVDFTYNRKENKVSFIHPDLEDFLGDPKHHYPKNMSMTLTFHTKKDNFLIEFPMRQDQLPYICNVKSGFRLLSPVPILFLPVPYDDQDEWNASTGVLETNKNIEINPQLYLNNYNGEDEKTWSIKAGENIQFCVPLTDEKWVIESELSVKDKLWLEAYRIVQSRSNVLCSEENRRGYKYSAIFPRMKKRLNDYWKTLWNK